MDIVHRLIEVFHIDISVFLYRFGGFGSNQNYYNQQTMGMNFPQGGGFGNDYGTNKNIGFQNPAQARGTSMINSAKAQLNQYVAQVHTFFSDSNRTLDTLNNGHKAVWSMSKELHHLDRILLGEIDMLKENTAQLSELIRKSEESTDIDYKSLVVPKDAHSAQLLDLVTENKAWVEASSWLSS